MSEKNLLEEGAVRRFMQLANIKSLNEGATGTMAGGRHTSATARNVSGNSAPEQMSEDLEEETAYEESSALEEAEGMDASMDGGEETGMEGGDIKSALEQIKAGLNALLGHLPEGGSEEFDLEDEKQEEQQDLEEAGCDTMEGSQYEGAEEKPMHEELEEEGKKPSAFLKKLKKDKDDGEDDDKVTEALAEELTRRVAARLMAEMKKGGAGLKQGAPFNKAAPKSKSAGHARNLTSGNTVAEGSSGAKKHAPKGHGPGVKQGAPFNKAAVPSKKRKQ